MSKNSEIKDSLVCLITAELTAFFPNKIVIGCDRLWSIEAGLSLFDFCRLIHVLSSPPNVPFLLTLPYLITTLILEIPLLTKKEQNHQD